jgi:hypothetical protein
MLEYTISLIGGEKDGTARIMCEARGQLCHMTICYGEKAMEEAPSDYFKALCQARLRLEKEGFSLLCYGSSLNVYPSGMCRDMGSGLQAYRLKIGKKPAMSDLVEIFEVGPDVTLATVGEQTAYFEEWLRSERV